MKRILTPVLVNGCPINLTNILDGVEVMSWPISYFSTFSSGRRFSGLLRSIMVLCMRKGFTVRGEKWWINVDPSSICLWYFSYKWEMCEYLWKMKTILWLFDLFSYHRVNCKKSIFLVVNVQYFFPMANSFLNFKLGDKAFFNNKKI